MEKTNEQYHPEPYWSEVAQRIASRKGENVIAGDDEPFYRYKRKRFLELLHSVDFSNKNVLEIGCGPGGNLQEVWSQKPTKLTAVDISADMIKLAKAKNDTAVDIVKINGTTLPFKDKTFDIVFTATVLQHNTDEKMLHQLMAEIARVSAKNVVFFERIETSVKGDDLCHGRPISYYENFMKERGFKLEKADFINIQTSYLTSGAVRKIFNPKSRKEGEPMTKVATFLQNATLPITKILDKVFTSQRDLGKLWFVRKD